MGCDIPPASARHAPSSQIIANMEWARARLPVALVRIPGYVLRFHIPAGSPFAIQLKAGVAYTLV